MLIFGSIVSSFLSETTGEVNCIMQLLTETFHEVVGDDNRDVITVVIHLEWKKKEQCIPLSKLEYLDCVDFFRW